MAGARLRPGLWDRLASRVEVGHVEGERGDEHDREDEEEGDGVSDFLPLEPEHTAAKALATHNGFPGAVTPGSNSRSTELRKEPFAPSEPDVAHHEGEHEGEPGEREKQRRDQTVGRR